MPEKLEFKSLREFYPFYLSQHLNATSRALHFMGTTLVIAIAFAAISTQRWWILALLPVVGYGFAWVGHFVFEKNRPATFGHFRYSLASDFIMWSQIVTGRIGPQLEVARGWAAKHPQGA